MSDIGRVRIFDGRMPESEGEIALTLGALERLGLSYELGQRIEVCYGKYYDYGELREKNMNQEYQHQELCGHGYSVQLSRFVVDGLGNAGHDCVGGGFCHD